MALIFSDVPLHYAEISAIDASTATTFAGSGVANRSQVNIFAANGPSHGATPDFSTGKITVTRDGSYQVIVSVSFSGGASDTIAIAVYYGSVPTRSTAHGHRKLGTIPGDDGSMSVNAILTLVAGDDVTLWAWNETDGDSITIGDVTMTLVQVG